MKVNIKARFKSAQEAGTKYTELAKIFEAAFTSDFAKLNKFKNSPSKAVNFAHFTNKRVGVSKSDLGLDPLIKFAGEELLTGHKDDYPFGLLTNIAVSGELRGRVKKLMKLKET